MVHEAATFVMFIHEEAVQSCGMAYFLAMKYNRRDLARQVVDHALTDLLPAVKSMIDNWGWLSPYAQGAFNDFYKASLLSFQNADAILKNDV